MKYKNNTQVARKKYLEGNTLSPEEQSIIDKDFTGEDFAYFESIKNTPLLLDEKYSAESTFQNITAITHKKTPLYQRQFVRYAVSVAAIAAIILISVSIFKNLNQQQLLIVSTTAGEQKQIELPDGTSVTLNSLSSISYPSDMDKEAREVKLKGEAYFDVTRKNGKTFVVKTDYLDIKVLGTKFNIEAYENQRNVTTSLFEGSVSVNLHNGGVEKLKPGDKGVYAKDEGNFEIKSSDNIDNEVYWITGILNFDNVSLSDIFEILEQEKKISINLDDNNFGKLKISARFTNNESVEEILDILGQSAGFTYNKKDNIYSIRRKL